MIIFNQSKYIVGICFPKVTREISWQDVSVSPAACPIGDHYDECYEIDFHGTNNEDMILLKDKMGRILAEGILKNHPNIHVQAMRKGPFDTEVLIVVSLRKYST